MVKEDQFKITKKWLRERGCSPEEVEKYSGHYLIQRWTYGAKKRAQSEAASYDVLTQRGDFDVVKYSIHKFIGCIKEAPFEITEESIDQLPDFLGELIEDKIDSVIGITPDQVKNLGLQLS